MPSDSDNTADTISVRVELSAPEWQLQTTMSVPKDPITLKDILPLAFSFADAVVDSAANGAKEGGRTISCKKGCGACCRQLVPLSESEAHWIRDLVDRLPESRRGEIRQRFERALQRLSESGLLEKLRHPENWQTGEGWSIAMDYFRLGISCPFLESEACSIHIDRPVKCREYLVTSPAENCRQPAAENIKMVELPFQMWLAMARLNRAAASDRKIPWVPLILALEWTDTHPESTHARPGQELLKEFFALLSGKEFSANETLGRSP